MKRIITATLALCTTLLLTAQPPARLRQQQAKADSVAAAGGAQGTQATRTTRNTVAAASVREFPVQPSMPEDVTWRRDIYRSLDLTKDANAPLYYPTEPQGNRMSLFTYLFKLMLRGQIKAYEYSLSGNEDFAETSVIKVKDIMDRNRIYYEQKDGRMRVNDADLPSASVKVYFIKESSYYDPGTATFRTKVDAICPVLVSEDEFGGAAVRYPLFWIRYDDVAALLARLPLMVSNLNNAATMSANDYFAMNRYDGEIYKTNNMQGLVLAATTTGSTEIDAPIDSTAIHARQKIERELTDVQKNVWGNDSTKLLAEKQAADSIAAQKAADKAAARTTTRTRRTTTPRVKAEKATTATSSSAASSTPRVTVRRQRR